MNRLMAYLKACRIEYFPAEIIGIIIPFLLAKKLVINIAIIEALLIFFLLYWSGFLINSLSDIEVDKKYKEYVANAIEELGVKAAKIILIAQVSIALLLTFHISLQLSNVWLFIFVSIATFFGLAYSIKPFHFKIRGIFHTTLAFSAMFAPSIFLYYVIDGFPSFPIFLIMAALTITHYGIALVNQSQDYMEDMEAGLRTPAIRWGLTETLIIALILSIIGLMISFIGIWFFLKEVFIAVFCFIILIIAYYLPVRGIWRLIKICIKEKEIKEKILRIKGMLNYPIWQVSGIIGLLLVSLLIFLM